MKLTEEQQQIVLRWRRYSYKVAMNYIGLKDKIPYEIISEIDLAIIRAVLCYNPNLTRYINIFIARQVKWTLRAHGIKCRNQLKGYNKYKLFKFDLYYNVNQDEFDDMISILDYRRQYILNKHYQEHKTFKEIAIGLNVTTQRVQQLHANAIKKLRKVYAT